MSDHQTKIDILSHDIQGHSSHELALSVLEGLSANPKGLPSRLFYDDKGSDLFKQIMALPEYYPTNCEAEILRNQGEKIASYFGDGKYNIIELGCGDGAKTIMFFNNLLNAKNTRSSSDVPCSKFAPIHFKCPEK